LKISPHFFVFSVSAYNKRRCATGYVRQADMAKVGFMLNLFCIAIIGGLAYFIWI